MKKSSFWNFWFSLIPGCGQLYLGASKKGVILLASFFGLIGLSAIIRFEELLIICPIIWFYAFFDAMNSRHLSEEQLKTDDKAFSDKVSEIINGKILLKKSHGVIGIILILVGLYMLADNFLPDFIVHSYIFYNLPTLAVAIGIIAFGAFLIKGKPSTPDFVEYKGGKNDGEQ